MANFNRYASNAQGQEFNGRVYHSKEEAKYARYLEDIYNKGEIRSWTPQKRIELFGENGGHVCNYYIDFLVEHNDDTIEFIEVKGFETAIWNIKWKLLKDKYGKNHKYKITLVKV